MLSFVVNRAVLQHVTLGKANGQSWESLAAEADVPAAELAQLPWRYTQKWDEYYPRAAELTQQERIARCCAKLELHFLETTNTREMLDLSRALNCLLRIQTTVSRRAPQAKRESAPQATDSEKTKQPTAPRPSDEIPELKREPKRKREVPSENIVTQPVCKTETNTPSETLASAVVKPTYTPPIKGIMSVLLFVTLCTLGLTTPNTTANQTSTLTNSVVPTEFVEQPRQPFHRAVERVETPLSNRLVRPVHSSRSPPTPREP